MHIRWCSTVAGTLFLSVLAAACSGTPDTIKIGVAQPLSGSQAARGQDTLRGAQMAVADINAAGGVSIGGKKVKLEIDSADDLGTEAGGDAAAHKLVGDDVEVAIADLNSQITIHAAPVYAGANVPQISTSTKPEYTHLGFPTTLRLVANDDLQSHAMGQYAAQLEGAQQYAIVDDGSSYGKALAAETAGVLTTSGKHIALTRSLGNNTLEFGPLIDELKAAKVDVLVTTLSDFQVIPLADQLAAKGLAGITIVGGNTLKTGTVLKRPLPVRAVYATSPIVDVAEFAGGPAFLDKFQKAYGAPPVYAAHYAYDAVFVVADALSRDGAIDKAALLKTLKSFDGNCPITNSIRFTESGEQRYGAVAVYEVRGGAWQLLVRSDRW